MARTDALGTAAHGRPAARSMRLRDFTPARVDTRPRRPQPSDRELLDFQLAHAKARDAVHLALDVRSLSVELQQKNIDFVTLASAARDRATYLHRPDLGRRLDAESRECLATAESRLRCRLHHCRRSLGACGPSSCRAAARIGSLATRLAHRTGRDRRTGPRSDRRRDRRTARSEALGGVHRRASRA